LIWPKATAAGWHFSRIRAQPPKRSIEGKHHGQSPEGEVLESSCTLIFRKGGDQVGFLILSGMPAYRRERELA
jgi:hypothetical protein